MISQFWTSTVQCARCNKVEPCSQPGQQPPGWVVMAYTESKFDPRQPTNPPQVAYVPYPFCGPVCASLFALMRAWGSLRTQDEKETFKKALHKIKWFGEVADDYGIDKETDQADCR